VTSILAGNVVSRTGRYKVFPVAGSLIMAVGLYLMSQLDVDTGFWRISLSMLVLGAGIGLSMQVLTIIVQNTSRYEDLGVATSAVTFFRTLGSSFGTAVFGAIYSNALASRIGPALAASPGVKSSAVSTPTTLHSYAASKIAPIVAAYADSLQIVFRYAVPVAAVAFVVSLFLKEVPLRGLSRSSATDLGDGFGMADPLDATRRLEVAVGRLMRKSRGTELPAIRANSGTSLGVADGWCVGQIRVRRHLGLPAGLEDIAHRVRVPPDVLKPAFEAAVAHGYLTGAMDDLTTTERGQAESDKIVNALIDWLQARLDVPAEALGGEVDGHPAGADGEAADRAALHKALDNLARSVLTDEALTPAA
jgi:hypothetical protein